MKAEGRRSIITDFLEIHQDQLQLFALINDVFRSDRIPTGSSPFAECDPIIRLELSRTHLGTPREWGKLAMQ